MKALRGCCAGCAKPARTYRILCKSAHAAPERVYSYQTPYALMIMP